MTHAIGGKRNWISQLVVHLITCLVASCLVKPILLIKKRKSFDPPLNVCGMIITKMQARLIDDQDARNFIHSKFGDYIRIFDFEIPFAAPVNSSVKQGRSLFSTAPRHKVMLAYKKLVEGVIANGK